MASSSAPIRQVWQSNLESEFALIRECLRESRFASMDTEFPGTIFSYDIPKHEFSSLSAAQQYEMMKENVNALNIIQLGLTLSNSTGRCTCTWEFNFRDFDPDYDVHNTESVAFLRAHGINFNKNKRKGIRSRAFAAHFLRSGLCSRRAWVTFHGLYDFGFLIKILTRDLLPDDLGGFMALVRRYLGPHVYDLKPIARSLGLHGGLDAVAKKLHMERAAGKSHQAGSDSLVTLQVFMPLLMGAPIIFSQFNYLLQGLTC